MCLQPNSGFEVRPVLRRKPAAGECRRKIERTFDATLNFAAWDDDLALIGALRDGVLGHATTVHPLLANFDELGWVRGVLRTTSDKRRHRAALPKNARCVWTVFKPERPALEELRELVEQHRVGLPIAVQESLAGAAQALDHVKKGRRGRALILQGGRADMDSTTSSRCHRTT